MKEHEIREALESHGFRLPPETFVKDDPRGSEYGEFTVTLAPGDMLNVTWQSCRHSEPHRAYTFTMRRDQFRVWAGECT
jgi:hypothetical protein